MANLLETIKGHPLIVFLAALLSGFIAGTSTYHEVLQWTNQETVIKGSYILKKDIAGTGVVLKNDAIREINSLIERGNALRGDKGEMEKWMLQVSLFVHYLGLPPEVSVEGERISLLEKSIRWAQTDPRIDVQVKKTLGCLQGFRDAEQTRTKE